MSRTDAAWQDKPHKIATNKRIGSLIDQISAIRLVIIILLRMFLCGHSLGSKIQLPEKVSRVSLMTQEMCQTPRLGITPTMKIVIGSLT
jgi:hypothetical protein